MAAYREHCHRTRGPDTGRARICRPPEEGVLHDVQILSLAFRHEIASLLYTRRHAIIRSLRADSTFPGVIRRLAPRPGPTAAPRRDRRGASLGQQLPLHLSQRCHDVEEEPARRECPLGSGQVAAGFEVIGQAPAIRPWVHV